METIIRRAKAGGIAFTAISTTLNASDIAFGTVSATIKWGLRDIEYYRKHMLHYPGPIGSAIAWQRLQVRI